VILTASRAFSDFSTSGLENPLTHVLLALFLVVYLRPGRARVLHLAALAALVMVGRLDAGLLVLPAVFWAAWRERSRAVWSELVLGFAPFWIWEGFSVLYYGALIPNSALAKLATGIGAGELARQGLHYFANSLRHDPVTLPAIATALLVAARRRESRSMALGLGIVLHLVWVLRVGGDFMSGRFFTAPLFMAVALLAQVRMRAVVAAALAGVALCAGGVSLAGSGFTDVRYRTDWHWMVPADGIVDERMFYDHKVALRHARGRRDWPQPDAISEARTLRDVWWRDPWSGTLKRWGIVDSTEQWPPNAVADAKGKRYRPLVVRGAIGYLAYDLGPDLHVLDFHALADPLLARLPIAAVDPALRAMLPEMANRRWRIGHFLRLVPLGYAETLLTGDNRIRDPDLARVYDQVALITRGPLFDRRRFGAIWAMNTGGHADAIRAYQARVRQVEPPPSPRQNP
jgi:arabinofuranosyltransferase